MHLHVDKVFGLAYTKVLYIEGERPPGRLVVANRHLWRLEDREEGRGGSHEVCVDDGGCAHWSPFGGGLRLRAEISGSVDGNRNGQDRVSHDSRTEKRIGTAGQNAERPECEIRQRGAGRTRRTRTNPVWSGQGTGQRRRTYKGTGRQDQAIGSSEPHV